jgi:hypothetical protein
MTSTEGIVGTLLFFATYEAILLYWVFKKKAHDEELYWRNENNRLENP